MIQNRIQFNTDNNATYIVDIVDEVVTSLNPISNREYEIYRLIVSCYVIIGSVSNIWPILYIIENDLTEFSFN